MKIIITVCFLAMSLFAMEPLVNAEWLHKSLHEKNLVIIDVSNSSLYKQGHIPNSVNSPISNWREKHGKFALVKGKEAIEKEFKKLGINKDSQVVIYSHHSNQKDILKASYILWAMEYYGFKNTAMLDGGLVAWQEDLYDVSHKRALVPKEGNFQVKADKNIVADMRIVKESIGKVNMIDARGSVFYFGAQKQPVLAKAGHVPHAKSYYWHYSFNGDYLKNKALLKKMLVDGMGLDPKKATITYCTGGLETSMNFFVLHRILGFSNIRLYDASMKQWANDASNPMTLYKWE
ncbi:sulfurtransferase [Sulfurimonas sp.]